MPRPERKRTSKVGDRSSQRLRDAVAAVVAAGDVTGMVREEIGASWLRSANSGLTPDRFDVPHVADTDTDAAVVRAARPIVDQLAADLAGTSMALLVTDAEGHVLDRRVSERPLQHRLDRILLAPGFVYAEGTVGTNAIGTALEQRGPSVVQGSEHFADALTTMACAAAPINDPRNGRIIGVIDLTCRVSDASPLMLPLATRAAREIEQRMIDGGRFTERALLQSFLRLRRGAKGPLVVVNGSGMITNAAADRLVEPSDEMILWETARRLLASHGDTAQVMLSGGTMVDVRVDPVVDGGSVTTAVLRFRPVATAAHDEGRSRGVRRFGWDSLTDTERSVTELVAQGLTNQQTAERLFLSRHTIDFHLRSIFRKLDVKSRVDLARIAVLHAST